MGGCVGEGGGRERSDQAQTVVAGERLACESESESESGSQSVSESGSGIRFSKEDPTFRAGFDNETKQTVHPALYGMWGARYGWVCR